MSTVLIYSTTGKSGFNIETQATVWEELQRDLTQNGVRFEGMKAVLGESRLTLESPKAHIPQEDFTLFLMPKKTKSGNLTPERIDSLSYKELRAEIKSIIDGITDKKEKNDAKRHFSEEGSNGKMRNYTQTKPDEMKINLKEWFRKFSTGSKPELTPLEDDRTEPVESEVVKDKIAEVVESIKSDKNRPVSTDDTVELLGWIENDLRTLDSSPHIINLESDEVESIADTIELVRKISKRIQDKREAIRLEEERLNMLEEKRRQLEDQAKALSREFGDVRSL